MSERARTIHLVADEQLATLIALVAELEPNALSLPCPGRAKLGDGTVGSVIAHTSANYRRIATFAAGADEAHAHPGAHATGAVDPAAILSELRAARERLMQIATLRDDQLDAIPAKDSFRFCDGQRSLAQVLTGLFTHQGHQVQALRDTLA